MWKTKRQQLATGTIFGVFMMMLWADRFFNEFFKMDQEAFEAGMTLNMGQLLSIPMFLAGLLVFIFVRKKRK